MNIVLVGILSFVVGVVSTVVVIMTIEQKQVNVDNGQDEYFVYNHIKNSEYTKK